MANVSRINGIPLTLNMRINGTLNPIFIGGVCSGIWELNPTPTAIVLSAEKLTNPGFESGTIGWYNYDSLPTFESSTDQAHSGSKSIHLAGADGKRIMSLAGFTSITNRYYKFSGWCYRTAGTYIDGYAGIAGNAFFIQDSAHLNQWAYGSTVNMETSGGSRNFLLRGHGDFNCYWDDVSAKEVSFSSFFTIQQYPKTDVYVCAPIVFTHIDGSTSCKGGVAAAFDDSVNPQNGLIAYFYNTVGTTSIYIALDKVVAGVRTNLIAGSVVNYDPVYPIGLDFTAGVASLWYAGKQVGTNQTITEAAILAGRYHGLFRNDEEITFGTLRVALSQFAHKSINSTLVADGAFNAFPGILRLTDGTLLAGYRRGTTHLSSDGDLYTQISRDDGATWESMILAYHPPVAGHDARDSKFLLLPNGNVLYSFFESWNDQGDQKGLCLIGVDDGNHGFDWGDPIVVADTINGFTDYNICTGKPILLADGTIYQAVYGKDLDKSHGSTAIMKSTDGGYYWGNKTVIAEGIDSYNGYTEAGGVLLPSGRMVFLIRCNAPDTSINGYFRVYADPPYTSWSPPEKVLDTSGSGPGEPVLLMNQDNSKMLMAFRDSGWSYWGVSADDGVVWGTPHLYCNIPLPTGSGQYADLVLFPNGDVGAIVAQAPDLASSNMYYTTLLREWF
jgi:hypothetical protein